MIDYKIIEFLMDFNQAIENLIDLFESFIKLYLENKKNE